MKQNASLVTQIVRKVSVVFTVMILVVLLATGGIFTSSMQQMIMENQVRQTEYAADTVDEMFRSLTTLIINLANYKETRRMLTEADGLYTWGWLTCVRNLNEYLFNIDSINSFITDIALMQPDSTICYSSTRAFSRRYAYTEADWFQEALGQKSLIKYAPPHGNEHLFDKVSSSFTAIYPVYSNKTLLGYIMVEINLGGMAQLFTGVNKGGTVDSCLITSEGEPVFYNGKNREIDSRRLAEQIDSMGSDGIASFWLDGTYCMVRRLALVDWYVVFQNDYQSIIHPVLACIRVVAGIILAGAAALIVVLTFLSRRVRSQFEQLIRRISSYDGERKIKAENIENVPREIRAVHVKFEEMAEHIDSLIREVYMASLLRQEMQMKVLVNQINPHFLYNTLQVIQAKAVVDENRELEDMIFSLGRMLRYSMNQQKDDVSVKEELEYIRDYIMFYRMRFPRLFTYGIICPQELLSARTLRFVLQPVVENCFRHGFSDRKEGGRIDIAVKERGADICLEVTDNGTGMSEEALDGLRKVLLEKGSQNHIGLANTHARIQLSCGTDYGLRIDSRPGEGTRVSILMPLRFQEESCRMAAEYGEA